MMEYTDLSPELKLILQKAEELDWTSTVWIEPSQNDRTYAEIGKHSPAGEDFSMVIDFDKEDQADTFVRDLREYFENFDVDEHVEMRLPSRGERGCPASVRELVEDAEAIEKMIGELLDAFDDMKNKMLEACKGYNGCEKCGTTHGMSECIDGERERFYGDVFVYVPSERQILRVSEGNGSNLLEEDEVQGYVDYIYYDQYELDSEMTNCDGGQVMLTELFRDKFKSTLDAVPAALDMAYGNEKLGYVVLGKDGVICQM